MRHLSFASLLFVVLGGCAVQAEGAPVDNEAVAESPDELAAAGVVGKTIKPLRANLVAVAPDGTVPTALSGWKLCDFDDNDRFVIRVKNNGVMTSTASITVVSGRRGAVALPTPALQPGEMVELQADFWSFASCTPDCNFTITVDAANQVIEQDEANAFAGWCIG